MATGPLRWPNQCPEARANAIPFNRCVNNIYFRSRQPMVNRTGP
jgi:hypothetical protein